MTTVFSDNVETMMTIGEKVWEPVEVEVELSQMDTPNYVHIITMVPGEGVEVPSPPDKLVSKDFELHVDNQLYSERTTSSNEETLLFKGKLANISAIGTRAYEGIAYDPSQQPLASPGENVKGYALGGNGSVLNQVIYLKEPYYGVRRLHSRIQGTKYKPKTVKASELASKIVNEIPGVTDYDIQLQSGGKTVSGPNGSVTGAYDRELNFEKVDTTIGNALAKIREECECEIWYDKAGKLYFGLPEPIAHELKFITDASDGLTTPPYQSVKVIGSGIASNEDSSFAEKQLVAEERIIVEGTFQENKPGEYQFINKQDISGSLPEPKFEYRNAEISTEAQAVSTAKSLVKDLAKQTAEGKITVTGFPEVTPFDAVIMPHADKEKAENGVPNYQSGMPMGGSRYGVYKVVHRLNGSDGFKTIIHVAGLTNTSRVAVPATGNRVTLIDRGDWSNMRPQDRTEQFAQGGDPYGRN